MERADVETLFPLKRFDGTSDPIPAGVVFADFILASYAEGGPSGTSHADAAFTIKKLGVLTA